MKLIPMRSLVLLMVMVIAAGLAYAAKPRERIADAGPKFTLDGLIPKQFGAWKLDERIVPVVPDPTAQALLNKLYSQTLARTYVDDKGRRIMLTIAYGGDQSDDMQVHRPEVCYAAQGFHILSESRGTMETPFGPLPVKRLLARQGPRNEPITYWVTVGGEATQTGFRQKLAQLSYGLSGKVPDGMLVRVSSIDRDEASAYLVQDAFVRQLLAAVREEDRARLGFAKAGA